jgi:hypothetical protein
MDEGTKLDFSAPSRRVVINNRCSLLLAPRLVGVFSFAHCYQHGGTEIMHF